MIPRIIHSIWVGPKPRPKFYEGWQRNHPQYEFMFWNEHSIKAARFSLIKHTEAFLTAGKYHGVADLVRYEVLHRYGGFVAPADSESVSPIDDLLDNDIFACYENEEVKPGLVSPHLGSVAGNGLLKIILDDLRSRESITGDPWKVTGNLYLTEKIKTTCRPIKIYPSHFFIPDHYSGKNYTGDGKIYARHYWGTTRKLYGKI